MDDSRTSKYENGCIMKLLRGYTVVPDFEAFVVSAR